MDRLKHTVFAAVVAGLLLAPLLGKDNAGKPRVVVTGLSESQVQELEQAVPDVVLVSVVRDQLADSVAEADAVIGSCQAAVLQAGKKLRWVQVASAGVEQCMIPELVESDITLTNAKIIMGPEIADHALALLLALTRNLRLAIPNQLQARWVRQEYSPVELRGKTALIIGLGGIGSQVAERAAAFGMEVLAIDPKDLSLMRSVQVLEKPDQLPELLPRADVVFMCAPHTPQTERMLGAKEFALMKRGAYFINVSRGRTVDTDALVQALGSGRLSGAGLDVVDPEPLPPEHPLWTLPNVVLTPHIAGLSDGIGQRWMELLSDNLRRFARGQPLRNVVDKQKGY